MVAACSALFQNDLKRVLAYSTMSQLGYMFMAAGVGAYGAAMFHLVTHAFFKALLFLCAGVVIHALNGEQDMRNMGGLGRVLPGTAFTFAVGAACLAGLPFMSGYFSKDEILTALVQRSDVGVPYLALTLGMVTAFLTAVYIARAFAMTFAGEYRGKGKQAAVLPTTSMVVPLWILALLSVVFGLLEYFASPLERFLAFGGGEGGESFGVMATSGLLAIIGYTWGTKQVNLLKDDAFFAKAAAAGFYFDQFFETVLIWPCKRIALFCRDVVEPVVVRLLPEQLGRLASDASSEVSITQNGLLRSYLLTVLGALVVILWYLLGKGGL